MESIALAAPVIFIAYAVSGMTGFGSAMVAVPILVQFLPLQFAVPMIVLFDLVCMSLVSGRNWRQVSIAELKRIFPWLLLGIILGVTLLHNAPPRWPLIFLGCFVLAVCIRGLRHPNEEAASTLRPRWAVPFGLIGGIFSALFGTGGPIYTIYLARRIPDVSEFRATISVVILVSGIIRAIAFGTAGLYSQPAILTAGAVLLPVSLIGLFVGSRLRNRISAESLKRFIYVLLLIAGIGAIVRGWLSPA